MPAQARWAPELAEATGGDTVAVHGLACWFDVEFNGSTDQRILSTSPVHPRTHWYQTILPLKEPLIVTNGASIGGQLTMTKNRRRSYDLDFELVCTTQFLAAVSLIALKSAPILFISVELSGLSGTDGRGRGGRSKASQRRVLAGSHLPLPVVWTAVLITIMIIVQGLYWTHMLAKMHFRRRHTHSYLVYVDSVPTLYKSRS